jgi:hypothetical protein
MLLWLLKSSEQAFVAVMGSGEQGTHDVLTGNRSMLCVLVVSRSFYGSVQRIAI